MSIEDLSYQSGFGNHFATEAHAGTLPQGRNSPQKVAHGLYAELISGTAFTAPRAVNRRSWVYRLRPSVSIVGPYSPVEHGSWRSATAEAVVSPPDPLRWSPFELSDAPADFIDGIHALSVNGSVSSREGAGVHVYLANQSMEHRYAMNADGEMLLVPQQGTLVVRTELGTIEVPPKSIGVVPRGVKFQVRLPDGPSRGYIAENYGAPFRLPELGPIGSNGLANPRDFRAPVASYENVERELELVTKFEGRLFRAELSASPLDVVAWHGNLTPVVYDLTDFNVMGSVSFDHPDPSIYTVLTSPSAVDGVANMDFVIFPPRWLVAEDTFRPPWYHRNVMSEFMGLIEGVYDAKATGFVPGGASLHNCMVPHGPDADAFERGSTVKLAPVKLEDTLAFMFETRQVQRPTRWALDRPERQRDYGQCWQGLDSRFVPPPSE